MAQRDLILEFIGVPGAGKSSLAAALAARLAADFEVDLPDRFDYRRKELSFGEKLRLDAIYGLGFLPYRMSRVLHDVRRSGIGLWTISNGWNQSRYPLVLLDRAAHAPKSFHVLDEWLLHRTIGESIRRYGSSIDFSRKFAIAPTPRHRCIYVSVDIDPELARERVLSQDQPFREFAKDKDAHRIDDFLALWLQQLQALKLEIDRRGLVLIDVDGGAPIETNVTLLYGRLMSVAAGGDARPTH